MNQVHVAVGSNIEPHVHVPSALVRLRAAFGDVAASPFYHTHAIDRPDQPMYWNGVVAFGTPHDRSHVHAILRAIEAEEGRHRSDDRWAPRTLDLDIIGWNGEMEDEVETRDFLRAGLAALLGMADETGLPVAWRAPSQD